MFNNVQRAGVLREPEDVFVFHTERIGKRNAYDAGMCDNQNAASSIGINDGL